MTKNKPRLHCPADCDDGPHIRWIVWPLDDVEGGSVHPVDRSGERKGRKRKALEFGELMSGEI